MPGLEIEDWSKPEEFKRTLSEYYSPAANTYSTEMRTPKASLEDIARDWREGGVRLYDMPAHSTEMQYHLELLYYLIKIL